MDATLWVLQVLMAVMFFYSGICKSTLPIRVLVDVKGQTGVEHLPLSFVRFIGTAEILGAFGLLLPWGLQIAAWLTPVASMLLAMVMIPAAIIHYRRHEPRNVLTNVVVFVCCGMVAVGRFV